jgi:dsDNA-binding SOS-regulon protein
LHHWKKTLTGAVQSLEKTITESVEIFLTESVQSLEKTLTGAVQSLEKTITESVEIFLIESVQSLEKTLSVSMAASVEKLINVYTSQQQHNEEKIGNIIEL